MISTTVFLAVFIIIHKVSCAPSHPHIVFVFADDLGWNDVSYQGTESATQTPYIDGMAAEGVKLNNYFVQPVCSPSRVGFLTGQYPYRLGVLNIFGLQEKACMPFVDNLLPEKLKEFGYSNHAVGKWHLGYCKTECLPTSRGFDSFTGYYGGGSDYFGGTEWTVLNSTGAHPMADTQTTYTLDIMDAKVTEIISSHDPDVPLFLYYAMQTVHSPIEPRPEDLEVFSSVEDETRRAYLALVKGMDDSMGVLKTALEDAGIYDDTIVIFSSDNGGASGQGASNWPLSGGKGSSYDGGIKAPSFIRGPGLTQTDITNSGLMHVTDWFPTLLSAIGEEQVSGLDGVNNWDMLANGGSSSRSELVHFIDTDNTRARTFGAARRGDYKVISDRISSHDRLAPPESNEVSVLDLDTEGVQLYNVANDPYETVNLAFDSAYADKKTEMMDMLSEYENAADVSPSIHVEYDDTVANRDADGAFITGWC